MITALAAILVCAFVLLNGFNSSDVKVSSAALVQSTGTTLIDSQASVVVDQVNKIDGLDGFTSEELMLELEMELMVSSDMIMDAENDVNLLFR